MTIRNYLRIPGILGIYSGFPFFDFQLPVLEAWHLAWHSLHFVTEVMTQSGGSTISSMRPRKENSSKIITLESTYRQLPLDCIGPVYFSSNVHKS